ncbi:MAG TPA: radical SAM family heme chaperone HemW [Chthoniobacteraceae bacterium]|nr:radical SAM family heme chaperone HemW [Chthoniobacteraceae bacterium]
MVEHLYFHIPFCPKLCPYCSFYVEVGAKHKTRRFLDALLREVELRAADVQPRTLYFGGGTPSALTVEQLDYLFRGLRERLDLSALEEWDLEANPATIRAEKAALLREHGVTRVSVGVQSWDDVLLKTLGRVHTAAQAERTLHTLRSAGFANLNVDLMFAVPGQTRAQWQATLERTISLRPEHISAYCLTYEEDTAYFHKLRGGEYRQDIDLDAELFERTMEVLPAAGYAQYEISNYARPGFESRHNQAYWRGADYLGFGPSAFSTVGLRRWQNIPDTAEYTRRIFAGENVASFDEELSPATRHGEIMAFAIRMREGLALRETVPWEKQLRTFRELGFLENRAGRVVLTTRGRMMADAVAEVFV